MPQLPSGLKIAISRHAILEPNREFFRCPEGNFWYQTPDLAINRPPFPRGAQIIMDFAHAPVPASRDEVKQYIFVIVDGDGSGFHWDGQLLSEFPRPGQLDDTDREAWERWLASDSQQQFLDEAIEACRVQAEANRKNVGWVKVVADDRRRSEREFRAEERIRRIAQRVTALEPDAERARAAGDFDRSLRIYAELEQLLAKIRELRKGCRNGAGPAHTEGFVLRVLERWPEAEVAFREALRSNPYHADSWLELTWCLASQGLLADAEEAARRTVDVIPKSGAAWGNLAMTLISRRKREEAREALDTALGLDPGDEKNRAIDEHFDELLDRAAPLEREN